MPEHSPAGKKTQAPIDASGLESLRQCYEQLRTQALDASQPSRGIGLNVLMRQGMAAWMSVVIAEYATRRDPSQSFPPQPRHAAACASPEWILILAGLVQGDLPAVEAHHG